MLKWLVSGLVVLLAAWIGLAAFGAWHWRKLSDGLFARLESSRTGLKPDRFDPKMLKGLPEPVRRYFRTALTEGQLMVSAVRLAHDGTFNMGESADNWKTFSSSQRVIVKRPGFVWDGRIRMLPGLPVNVHDAYVGGEGILHPAIFGLFSLTELRDTGDLAAGELMRFLAEAAWYPTALLPSQDVNWEAVNDQAAVATLVDGKLKIQLTFKFGEDGLISSVVADSRGRTVAGKMVPTRWEGRWSNYQNRDGMLVPITGEVAWLLPEGEKVYWRGTIASLAYEFAPPHGQGN